MKITFDTKDRLQVYVNDKLDLDIPLVLAYMLLRKNIYSRMQI